MIYYSKKFKNIKYLCKSGVRLPFSGSCLTPDEIMESSASYVMSLTKNATALLVAT